MIPLWYEREIGLWTFRKFLKRQYNFDFIDFGCPNHNFKSYNRGFCGRVSGINADSLT